MSTSQLGLKPAEVGFSLYGILQLYLSFPSDLCWEILLKIYFEISKKIFQITILNLKFKFPDNNRKQQIQISSSG